MERLDKINTSYLVHGWMEKGGGREKEREGREREREREGREREREREGRESYTFERVKQ